MSSGGRVTQYRRGTRAHNNIVFVLVLERKAPRHVARSIYGAFSSRWMSECILSVTLCCAGDDYNVKNFSKEIHGVMVIHWHDDE